ncbi:MAG: hypothetical protein H6707_05510 [Deltaproteobacteria bacterium]|nr:hypothetical protein [Deltaproteobacteria bacterium]
MTAIAANLTTPDSEVVGQALSYVVGYWSAGETLLVLDGESTFANLWFCFENSGCATMRVRWHDHRAPLMSNGRWWLEDDVLVAAFGEHVIRSEVQQRGETLFWAGRALVPVPFAADSEIATAGSSRSAPTALPALAGPLPEAAP